MGERIKKALDAAERVVTGSTEQGVQSVEKATKEAAEKDGDKR